MLEHNVVSEDLRCIRTLNSCPSLMSVTGSSLFWHTVRRSFGMSIAVCAFSACAVLQPSPTGQLKQATAEELTALLRQREAAMQSMKGLFSAKVRGGVIPIASRVEGAVYYRRPNALRLRGFTPIGGELFEFVQMDDLYKLRLPTMGRVLVGRESDMEEMGKLARPFQLSVWAVSGVLGTSSLGTGETAKLAEEGDRYRLDVYAAPNAAIRERMLVRRLWFDRRTLLVVQEDRLGGTGEVDATIHYDDFRPLDNQSSKSIAAKSVSASSLIRPFKIFLEDGRGQGSVQVTFHEIVPNLPIKAEELGQLS